jgi:hypothetical protein
MITLKKKHKIKKIKKQKKTIVIINSIYETIHSNVSFLLMEKIKCQVL